MAARARRRALPARATAAALHALLLLAIALAASALVAWRRAGRAAARVPLACAALAALIWVERGALVERAIGADSTSGRRVVAAVVAPGYALLRDERSFAAVQTAWRETRVDGPALSGEGWFGARIADPGVAMSIENDYLAVLVVRETGVAGATATCALLLAALGGAWWLGTAARRHGSRGGRRRAVVALGLARSRCTSRWRRWGSCR
ncbi:MAG: hypothetical protein H6709_22940 [Kofleriaceae bacterium]|nr:hypothetical protein [Kofleriaceae bacterium]